MNIYLPDVKQKIYFDSPTVFDVGKEILKKPWGIRLLLFKPVMNAFKWADFFDINLPKQITDTNKKIGNVNTIVGLFNYPLKIEKLFNSIKCFFNKTPSPWETVRRVVKVFYQAASLTAYLTNAAEVAKKVKLMSFSLEVFRALNVVCFVVNGVLFVNSSIGFIKYFKKTLKERFGSYKWNYAALKIAIKASKLALSIFGMVVFSFGNLAISSGVFLVGGSILLYASIASQFYARLHERNVKGVYKEIFTSIKPSHQLLPSLFKQK